MTEEFEGRLCDQPPHVQATIMMADPEGYWSRVRAERLAEAQEQVAEELRARRGEAS